MAEATQSSTNAQEFEDDASYGWWLNSHPAGFVLAVTTRRPPVLHTARCKDIDRDRRPGRLKAKGSRQICAAAKLDLRNWAKQYLPPEVQMLARCPKCAP
jgi:hypothetical protein